MDAAARRNACRCSTPASAALKASGTPDDKAAVAKSISTLKTTTMIGPGRFHERAGAERLARPDRRHAMGEGARRVEVQARLPDDRNATDPNVPVLAKLIPFNG